MTCNQKAATLVITKAGGFYPDQARHREEAMKIERLLRSEDIAGAELRIEEAIAAGEDPEVVDAMWADFESVAGQRFHAELADADRWGDARWW